MRLVKRFGKLKLATQLDQLAKEVDVGRFVVPLVQTVVDEVVGADAEADQTGEIECIRSLIAMTLDQERTCKRLFQ